MLKRIVVKNVGVLRAFSTPASPKLERLTTIYARNGRGKSTLTALLRAANDGAAQPLVGRRSFGSDRLPEVFLEKDAATVRFTGERWSSSLSVEVFDTRFIAENVHAGEVPELEHDRGLFSVIVGRDGVRLERRLAYFSEAAKRSNAALKAGEQALALDHPTHMPLADFVAYVADGGLEERIAEAERVVRASREAGRLASLPRLSQIALPEAPASTAGVLESTLAEVDATARDRLKAHFQGFGLGKEGKDWVRFGLRHVHDGACPMCGRGNADELGLLTIYANVFSDTYEAHMAAVSEAASAVDAALGDRARAGIAEAASGNAAAVRAWSDFHDLSPFPLPDLSDALADIAGAHNALGSLLARKRASPMDPVRARDALEACDGRLARARTGVERYNAVVEAANASLDDRRHADAVPEARADSELADLRKLRNRIEPGVVARVGEYRRALRRDERAKRARKVCQERLKAENLAAAEHYHDRVNRYLDRFTANFRISRITNSMAGNAGSSDYGLVVRGTQVDRMRGKARQAEGMPSFRNTLSTADKTTLALAFFLSKLDQDPGLADRIVVFDDPLSSHDSHRRTRTIEALRELGGRCGQLVVLSHDEWFVRDLCRACHVMRPVTYHVEFDGPEAWSVARSVDPDELCRSEHASMVDALRAYHERRSGDPSTVVLHVRRVLETHYRRSFSAWFSRGGDLGEIVESIRKEGRGHPCFADFERLRTCNEATRERHHGEDAALRSRSGIDPDELWGIARDALVLIGATKP